MGEQVLPYNPERDSHQAFSLWERNFGDRWPITREIFREVTEAVHYDVETRHLVVRDSSEELLGYAVTQLRPRRGDEASIVLLTVDPARQRQGVGTRLLSAVLEGLAEDGISLVHAGANALGPFWQGIPVCLPAARAFSVT